MNESACYETRDDFLQDLVANWLEGFSKYACANHVQLPSKLYTLSEELLAELSPTQIIELPIESVYTFLLGSAKGVPPSTLIHCFLTSPVDLESLAILKIVHSGDDKVTHAAAHHTSEALH